MLTLLNVIPKESMNWVETWMKFCWLRKKSLNSEKRSSPQRKKKLSKFYKEKCQQTSCKTLKKISALSCFSREFMTRLQHIFPTWSTKFTQNFPICWQSLTNESLPSSDNSKKKSHDKRKCNNKKWKNESESKISRWQWSIATRWMNWSKWQKI